MNINNTINECVELLIGLEPQFELAGTLSLKLQPTVTVSKKFQTGIHVVDIVTEADIAVQEFILSAMLQTKLIGCNLIAEEDTPVNSKFKGTNNLTLTLDPIDGTFIYTGQGRFFSIIVCLYFGSTPLYTYCHYPAVGWTRRITNGGVKDFGKEPDVKLKSGLDLSRTISYTYGQPETLVPELYRRLTEQGYVFRLLDEITDESGTCTLLFLNKIAGYFKSNPSPYDGLCALHYGQVRKFQILSSIDISKAILGSHGLYYLGWYMVLRT